MKIPYHDEYELNPAENVNASIIVLAEVFGVVYAVKTCVAIMKGMTGKSADGYVIGACCLATFDAWYRNPSIVLLDGGKQINPNSATIKNMIAMVRRSCMFFKSYGGIMKCCFDFWPNGYTTTITSGDGDFLTADTLWDMKVLRSNPPTLNALQVLTYWVMSQHSGQ